MMPLRSPLSGPHHPLSPPPPAEQNCFMHILALFQPLLERLMRWIGWYETPAPAPTLPALHPLPPSFAVTASSSLADDSSPNSPSPTPYASSTSMSTPSASVSKVAASTASMEVQQATSSFEAYTCTAYCGKDTRGHPVRGKTFKITDPASEMAAIQEMARDVNAHHHSVELEPEFSSRYGYDLRPQFNKRIAQTKAYTDAFDVWENGVVICLSPKLKPGQEHYMPSCLYRRDGRREYENGVAETFTFEYEEGTQYRSHDYIPKGTRTYPDGTIEQGYFNRGSSTYPKVLEKGFRKKGEEWTFYQPTLLADRDNIAIAEVEVEGAKQLFPITTSPSPAMRYQPGLFPAILKLAQSRFSQPVIKTLYTHPSKPFELAALTQFLLETEGGIPRIFIISPDSLEELFALGAEIDPRLVNPTTGKSLFVSYVGKGHAKIMQHMLARDPTLITEGAQSHAWFAKALMKGHSGEAEVLLAATKQQSVDLSHVDRVLQKAFEDKPFDSERRGVKIASLDPLTQARIYKAIKWTVIWEDNHVLI